MDYKTLEYLQGLMRITAFADNSRTVIEKFLKSLREEFVFDNVAVYLRDGASAGLEVVYARAIGRAKNAEADAAWGETFARQVLSSGRLLLQDPQPHAHPEDRLSQAYLLGLPMRSEEMVTGAVVVLQFDGHIYRTDHIGLASFAAELLATMFERAAWHDIASELRELRRQMQLQEDFVGTISDELGTPLG